jgi:chemotaxis protein MotB
MLKGIVSALCLVLAAGCGPSKDEFATVQRDAANNKKLYEDEAEKSKAMEQKIADLEKENAGLKQQIAESQKKVQEAEAKSAQYEQLSSSLQEQITSGKVEISELKGKMTVKLKDKVVFSSASAALTDEGKKALDAVADAFKNLKGKSVLVAGYTDDVPVSPKSGFKDNWALSSARAQNVVRYLQSKGVPPSMLAAAGFGEFRPIAPNDTPANRSQNRRIEIALTASDYTPPVVEVPKS